MATTSNENEDLYYKMDNACLGNFYINIRLNTDDAFKGKLEEVKKEIKRLGFNIKHNPNNDRIDDYIKEEIKQNKFSDDNCIALLNCVRQNEIKNELSILKEFHVDEKHQLYEKPKIIILMYQEEKMILNSEHDADSEPNPLPIEAHMVIIRIQASDMSLAIGKLSNALKTIKNKTDIYDFLKTLVVQMKPVKITTHTALMKRLQFELGESDKNVHQLMENNKEFSCLYDKLLHDGNKEEKVKLLREEYKYIEKYYEKIKTDKLY